MVVHEAVGVAYPVEAPADLAKENDPVLAVSIVQIDGLPPVASRGNVVQSAGEFNSQRVRTCVDAAAVNVSLQDLTP